ncbi:MAG: histidinol-phosphatase HisJ [Tissierellales bacterium]|jgi:histidinol-phosphatase (PHP family)|nr:histidinol-phosphatase HisJ [Tissierellales bacterium]MBN2827422.1 histidinol-phosphatase HisJ [Tissierellales bacterium]
MEKFNFHSHTDYCDGIDTAENMIRAAIKKRLKYYGVSSHGPVPFETDWTMKQERLADYLEEIESLKQKYRDQIVVFIGLEIDYLPDLSTSFINKELLNKLDYTIGSVHFLGKFRDGSPWTVDYNRDELAQGIKESFGGDVRLAVQTYYRYIASMCEAFKPDVVGHLDLIKKSNRNNYFFNEDDQWYQDAVLHCLMKIKQVGCIVEVNTGGKFRGYTEAYYPSDWILKTALQLEIPVTVSTDSHSTDAIDFEFEEACQKLKDIGFCKISVFNGQGWAQEEI